MKILTALKIATLVALPVVATNAADSQPAEIYNPELSEPGNNELVDRLHAAGLISDDIYKRQQRFDRPSAAPSLTPAQPVTVRGESLPGSSGRAGTGRYVALVIGSNDYTEFETLETAVDDARAIANTLQVDFGFETELVLNPTRRQLISSLNSYRDRLSADDHFLLYYAGHGYLEQSTRRGYWLPVDAEPDNPSNWISNVEIADAVSSLKSDHVLVIADSCFAGSLAQSQTEFTINDNNIDTGANRSRIVITSGGLEPVLDTGFGRHSVFAQALLDQLSTYTNESSLVALFNRIRSAVVRQTHQQPQLAAMQFAGHRGGSFRLRRTDAT